MSRWRRWIAQPPPKGQVGGSNPPRDAQFPKVYTGNSMFFVYLFHRIIKAIAASITITKSSIKVTLERGTLSIVPKQAH